MNTAVVSLLLAVVGGSSMLASWVQRRDSAAPVATWLTGSVGAFLLAVAAALFLVVAGPGGDTPLRPLMP